MIANNSRCKLIYRKYCKPTFIRLGEIFARFVRAFVANISLRKPGLCCMCVLVITTCFYCKNSHCEAVFLQNIVKVVANKSSFTECEIYSLPSLLDKLTSKYCMIHVQHLFTCIYLSQLSMHVLETGHVW